MQAATDISGGPLGPEGFSIPRHHEGGFQDVRKMIVKKTRNPLHGNNLKKAEVLHFWSKLANAPARATEEDVTPAHRRSYHGICLSGNEIFDSSVLMEATVQLKRQDLREKNAAIMIQRRWRKRPRMPNPKPSLLHHGSKWRATTMSSKTIAAPAYFGESCLWSPIEQWGKEDPPLYTYTARCESRCELVYIGREAIQEIVERFSPWLGERLETFRKSVVGQLSEMVGAEQSSSLKKSHTGEFQPEDWASMDLLPPQDDFSMDASHCKTLLRTAVPSRTQMTILRSAATHSRPAMPRTPSYVFSDPPRGRGLHRMRSGQLTGGR